MNKLGSLIVGFVVIGLLVGCTPTFKYGRWPDTSNLESLKLYESDMDEVRVLLGEPHGMGQGRTPDFPKLATIWSYEYTVSTVIATDFSLLIIGFIDGRYYGYTWFSSQQKTQVSH